VEPSREDLTKALGEVIDPELRRPVTELDMVRSVDVTGGDVRVTLALTVAGCPLRSSFEDQVQRAVGAVPGVERVSLAFDVMSPDERQALTTKLRGGVTERTKGISLDASTRVLAIASGKGGVGKSTVSVNLAAAFAGLGHRTGILDADVYGHSIPHMLAIRQKPVLVDRMIVPPVKSLWPPESNPADRPVISDGRAGEPARPESDIASGVAVKLMSIGFFLEENEPVMWRGPMLHRALEQFLSDVHWGELDTLIVDMPPGTGDVSISLGQLLPRAEAVVVTTPQPLAQEVASRAAVMARKTNMRLIGVVENMSGEVFGSGGGDALAAQLEVPLLGRVPLDPEVRACGDGGSPLVTARPESETARELVRIAEAIHATKRERGVGIVKPLTLA
jgi:ATP-binding protein involved in chromosome partitioning